MGCKHASKRRQGRFELLRGETCTYPMMSLTSFSTKAMPYSKPRNESNAGVAPTRNPDRFFQPFVVVFKSRCSLNAACDLFGGM
jgi:hypothetical protein